MKAILLVAFGGAAGALARWAMAGGIDQWARGSRFPWGTVAVNAVGCLIIGLLYGLAETRAWLTDATRWLLFVGFLGSFTTFSTFSWQSFDLLRQGHAGLAFANLLGSVALGLACVWLGYWAGK
ncbi:MAG: fluoride efflux transporter CrcB [Verrucomicrobiales bacterium]|nr:fluoride efflux transporter CrcB [Verrucomicrobiales bacterium]